MPGLTLKRFAAAGVAVVLLCVVVAWEQPAQAGGPLIVGGTFEAPGEPFVWSTTSSVPYTTDQGPLGSLSNGDANTLVLSSFAAWQDVPTANIGFTRTGDLAVDVVGGASDPTATPPKVNHMNFFDNFINDCLPPQFPAPSNAVNAIVYDTDGSITDGILGANESNSVIGFAGVVCISSIAPNRLTRGRAVMNGKFIDPLVAPDDLPQDKYTEVFIHEFGHLIGLDHSQINVEVLNPAQRDNDRLFGLPVMFPVLLSSTKSRLALGFPLLAPDDEAWVSFLYPETISPPTFNSTFGRINGTVFFSDGVTPVQGTNLIARLEDVPANPDPRCVNESRCFAYSSTSGYLFTGNPGQTATPNYLPCTPASACGPSGFLGNNTGGSRFGSRDPNLIGFYQIPVKAGSYTLEVEAIDPDWVEGSRVGPLGGDAGEQFPLPGTALAPTSLFPVAEGAVVPQNITLINTPPRFDSFESARLHWREPAPAWLRERRPPAFLVAG